MIWSIAWRNIWRNKTRSLVIIFSIIIGLFGGTFYFALSSGLMEQRINSSISNEISNIQIHHPEYLLNEDMKFTIGNYDTILSKIITLNEIKAFCTRIKALGMASTAETGSGVMINGIDVNQEKQVTKLFERITEGNYFSENDKIPVVISQKLSKKLNARLKSKIVFTVANSDGIIVYGAFRVVGIFNTENDIFDEVNVFVRKNELANMLEIQENKINEIAIALYDNLNSIPVANLLKKEFVNLIQQKKIVIRPWTEIVPSLSIQYEMSDFFAYIVLIVILAALSFGIVNTMLMAIMERIKELGMLKAIGMNGRRIFKMILLETVFLSAIGGFIGLFLSLILTEYYSYHGINLEMYKEGFNAMGFSSKIYTRADTEFYIIATFLVIIVAIISSIYPTQKALNLNPAAAMREND